MLIVNVVAWGAVALLIIYLLVLIATEVIPAIIRYVALARDKRTWDRLDAVQRAGLGHEHVNGDGDGDGDGSVQGLVGRGHCPICGEFVDNEVTA